MDKRIYEWQVSGYTFTRGFIFGNYDKSLTAYTKLVNEAKAAFPELTDDEIQLGSVRVSTYMEGFTLVTFLLPVGTRRPEYKLHEQFDFTY